MPRYYDAHNHLQDPRLNPWCEEALAAALREGVQLMVVNGSCEQDWPAVLALSRRHPQVVPSFGYHPWYVQERTPAWLETLKHFLDQVPAGVGEVGLDRWVKGHDLPAQEEVFLAQLRLAAGRNLPLTIHCLQAWGRLVEILQAEPRPACGFVLHSFGGPRELIGKLADLGAYFSLPGYFAQDRKERQRESFRHVPPDRLLIETDAPDQTLPPDRTPYPLADPATGRPLNHPANLPAVYHFAAELLGESPDDLAARVEANFFRLFGAIARPQTSAPTERGQ